jgi:hypothetical protein
LDRRLAAFAVASEAANILNNSAHSDIKGSANFMLINSASTSNSNQKSVSSASSVTMLIFEMKSAAERADKQLGNWRREKFPSEETAGLLSAQLRP